jgi:hypothetical protein
MDYYYYAINLDKVYQVRIQMLFGHNQIQECLIFINNIYMCYLIIQFH